MENKDFKNEKAAKYWLHYFRRNDIQPLTEAELQEESDLIFKSLMAGQAIPPAKVKRLWYPAVAVAAAVGLILVSAGLFFFNQDQPVQHNSIAVRKVHDVAPGITTATLILSDGRDVVLANAMNGKIAEQSGTYIFKTADNKLVYKTNSTAGNPAEFNTVLTAKGQQYQVVLPDGSKVWLNAASSVKFPATFAELKNRVIELTGEAYFEVTKDKQHPFIVKTSTQQIRVLGTHFNVKSYADEAVTRTTLLEGSVRVYGPKADLILKPGQQSQVSARDQKLSSADVSESVAWKNGDFIFNDEEFSSVLKQVSRWYNVEIIDEAGHAGLRISGTVSRSKNLSVVLKGLEKAGQLKFKIIGRQVVVTGK